MKVYIRIFAPVFTMLMTILSQGDIFQRTLSKALSESSEEKRPLLLFFTSDGCEPCRSLELYLQQDDVRKGIENKYVAAIVDIADFDGKACGQIYDISQTPALIVASSDGEVLFRNDGRASREDIQALLTGQRESPSTRDQDAMASASAPAPSPPTGQYAVQLGFFSNHENAMRLRDRARSNGYGSAYLQEEVRDGKQYYRVLVGPYPDASHAQATMVRLDRDGFPVKLHERKS